MDEKTEELRDIFIDVTDEDTVTEQQADERGSLTPQEGDMDRVREVIAEMREATSFGTDLDDEALTRVVSGFYEGDSDTEIAEAVDVSRSVVFRARMDLHLVRERDTDAPFPLEDLREMLAADTSIETMADELDVSASTVRRYARVVEARNAARRVSHRFQSEFEDAFTDADLSANMTEDVKEDGLEDATEGMETDVSF